MNTRRNVLGAGAAWPALTWTGGLPAQTKAPVLIGNLTTGSLDSTRAPIAAFNEAMAGLGWKLGTQYVIEARHAEGQVDRLPALAQELAAFKPALFIAVPSSAARALATAAPTTPIVLWDGDPVAAGLVTNLARPGGMITGFSNVGADLLPKLVELLVEALPKIKRIGFLADSTVHAHTANVASVRRAAERLGVEAVIAEVAKPADIEPAMVRLAKGGVQGLVIMSSAWFGLQVPKIVALAVAQRWPVVGFYASVPQLGGLLSYGRSGGRAQRVAVYVDRILKGAKPGDLPIEQPTTFDLVLNLKTAKTLGITIPPSVLLRATVVIE